MLLSTLKITEHLINIHGVLNVHSAGLVAFCALSFVSDTFAFLIFNTFDPAFH